MAEDNAIKDDSEKSASTVKLQFHYIKGPEYREIACHGAIGGVTPQGLVWMAVYAERPPIPRLVEFDVPVPESSEGFITFEEGKDKPAFTESRHGVVRHIECTTYMDVETAKRMHEWLGRHIKEAEAQRAKK